jgi:hypothetical protein
MVIIDENSNLLNSEEWSFLGEKCNNFNPSQTPILDGEYLNYFYRQFLDIKDINVVGIVNKCEKYIREQLKTNNLLVGGMWINRIDINSNKDDNFHTDITPATLIIYLNDDFEDGEFEYVDISMKNKVKIKPKKNLTISMNNRLEHRVLPVSSGVRYSLVSFFTLDDKKNKSLI